MSAHPASLPLFAVVILLWLVAEPEPIQVALAMTDFLAQLHTFAASLESFISLSQDAQYVFKERAHSHAVGAGLDEEESVHQTWSELLGSVEQLQLQAHQLIESSTHAAMSAPSASPALSATESGAVRRSKRNVDQQPAGATNENDANASNVRASTAGASGPKRKSLAAPTAASRRPKSAVPLAEPVAPIDRIRTVTAATIARRQSLAARKAVEDAAAAQARAQAQAQAQAQAEAEAEAAAAAEAEAEAEAWAAAEAEAQQQQELEQARMQSSHSTNHVDNELDTDDNDLSNEDAVVSTLSFDSAESSPAKVPVTAAAVPNSPLVEPTPADTTTTIASPATPQPSKTTSVLDSPMTPDFVPAGLSEATRRLLEARAAAPPSKAAAISLSTTAGDQTASGGPLAASLHSRTDSPASPALATVALARERHAQRSARKAAGVPTPGTARKVGTGARTPSAAITPARTLFATTPRSTRGGRSASAKRPGLLASPHGPIAPPLTHEFGLLMPEQEAVDKELDLTANSLDGSLLATPELSTRAKEAGIAWTASKKGTRLMMASSPSPTPRTATLTNAIATATPHSTKKGILKTPKSSMRKAGAKTPIHVQPTATGRFNLAAVIEDAANATTRHDRPKASALLHDASCDGTPVTPQLRSTGGINFGSPVAPIDL